MRRIIFWYSSIVMLVLASCSHSVHEKDILLYQSMIEGLRNSNDRLEESNRLLMHSIKAKLEVRESYESAKLWNPKSLMVKDLSDDMHHYIQQLKENFYDTINKPNSNYIMDELGNSNKLYDKLQEYKINLFKIDSGMTAELRNNYTATTRRFDLTEEKKDFSKAFFDNVPPARAIAVFYKFQNNVRIIENDMLIYCNKKAAGEDGWCGWGRDMQEIITNQSVSHAKPGEKIEIKVGFGNFVREMGVKIIIDGKEAKQEFDGRGVTSIKASNKPGMHTIPVKVEFTDWRTGLNQWWEKQVYYYVDSIPAK
jgi:hypothetical protein